jgi:hypothetical protein
MKLSPIDSWPGLVFGLWLMGAIESPRPKTKVPRPISES